MDVISFICLVLCIVFYRLIIKKEKQLKKEQIEINDKLKKLEQLEQIQTKVEQL